jgi:Sugar-transfer associated ATP-grasp
MSKPQLKSITGLIAELLKDPDRKSLFRMIRELLYLSVVFRSFPRHYFSRYLFKKESNGIMNYYPDDFLNFKVKPLFNNREVIDVLENKLFFNFFYGQFNISLPEIIMYNHGKMFVKENTCIAVNSTVEFRQLLEGLFKENPGRKSIFIKKTYWSYGGDGIYKLYPAQLENDPRAVEKLYSDVTKAGFLFQETVRQHPDLDRLNPSCLNTIRLDTFTDSDGNIEILSGYIRMSTINFHLDNISSGGCQVGIDLATGKLKKNGYFTIRSNGVRVLTGHPVTRTIFRDFQLPLFTQAKDLVKKAAGYMPEIRLVGWDVAISDTGPVLIEGNSNYDMQGNDLADEGYAANPVFRKVLLEAGRLSRKD